MFFDPFDIDDELSAEFVDSEHDPVADGTTDDWDVAGEDNLGIDAEEFSRLSHSIPDGPLRGAVASLVIIQKLRGDMDPIVADRLGEVVTSMAVFFLQARKDPTRHMLELLGSLDPDEQLAAVETMAEALLKRYELLIAARVADAPEPEGGETHVRS